MKSEPPVCLWRVDPRGRAHRRPPTAPAAVLPPKNERKKAVAEPGSGEAERADKVRFFLFFGKSGKKRAFEKIFFLTTYADGATIIL